MSYDIGDRITIKRGQNEYQGIVMPSQDPSLLILKLSSGYNVGFEKSKVEVVKVEKHAASLDHEQEEDIVPDPEISILGCGGTIASRIDYRSGAVYPASTPKELAEAFPTLKQLSKKIRARVLFQLVSEDMHPWFWTKMAEEVYAELKDGANGVVLMHGTDTMHYSSAALSFALQGLGSPVVFVGAQRSSDRPSSDNEMNLLNAVFSAKQDFAEVCVCMHATINDTICYLHRGTKVRKMHTSRRDAFQSINIPPLATVDYREKRFDLHLETKPRSNTLPTLKPKFSDNVAMLYIHPGIKPELIHKLADYDGVVVVATGLGHIPCNSCESPHAVSLLEPMKELIDSGVVVVVAPQTIYGRINMNVYTPGRRMQEAGIIGQGMDWTPETAFVKLSWLLAYEHDPKRVRKLMMENMVNETTTRSIYY